MRATRVTQAQWSHARPRGSDASAKLGAMYPCGSAAYRFHAARIDFGCCWRQVSRLRSQQSDFARGCFKHILPGEVLGNPPVRPPARLGWPVRMKEGVS